MTDNQKNLTILKNHVGEEVFCELMESFSGQDIYFTPCYNIHERNRNIRRDYESGMTIDQLVRKYELSRSRIYDLIDVIPK